MLLVFLLVFLIPVYIAYKCGKLGSEKSFFSVIKKPGKPRVCIIISVVCAVLSLTGLFWLFILVEIVAIYFIVRDKDGASVNQSVNTEYKINQETSATSTTSTTNAPVDIVEDTDTVIVGNDSGNAEVSVSSEVIAENTIPISEKQITEAVNAYETIYKANLGRYAKGPFQYKCVPAPTALRVSAKENPSDAVRQYASIIDKEAVGGWEFFLISEIPVIKSAGCIRTLLGKSGTFVFFNMLIFRKLK